MDTRALRARRTLVEGTHDVMNRQAREANGEFGAGDGTPSGGGPASPTAVRSDLAADGITAPGASNSATTHDGQVVQTSAKNGASVKTIGGDTEVHATGPVRDAVEKSLTKNGYTFNAYAPGKYVVTK